MTLYFRGGSKQKKVLISSDFAEDICDVILGFFEEHGKYPHFLQMDLCAGEENVLRISFGSSSEFFFIEQAAEEEIRCFEDFIREYNA